MTYRGHVKQGVIVLDSPVQLPEGAQVEVRAADEILAQTTWAEDQHRENDALVSGSVAATTSGLPQEDFSDWEK